MSPRQYHRRIGTHLRVAVEQALGDLRQWHHQCHAASAHLVHSGVLPEGARVARGTRPGVPGQHSWVVLGGDVYNPEGIIDPTLWSYTDVENPKVVYAHGVTRMGVWHPHGAGSIWMEGCPRSGGAKEINLGPLSDKATHFLDLCRKRARGPLDRVFYMGLVNGPMNGWPSREIVEALIRKGHGALIPIDIIGHLTDQNPGGLYLPGGERG